MYIIIKTTVTISMIQKNTVHNVILYTTNKFKEGEKKEQKEGIHAGKTTFVYWLFSHLKLMLFGFR